MKKALLVLAGFVVGATLATFLAFLFFAYRSSRGASRVPTLAGVSLPSDAVALDFDRLIDMYCEPVTPGAEPLVFERCRILGVVGQRPISKGSFESYRYDYFGDWICLEFEDGRRAYLPKGKVEYFIDSEPDAAEN
jgi:hypothetical protein